MQLAGTRPSSKLGYEELKRHSLRHTGLTWMADAGVPVQIGVIRGNPSQAVPRQLSQLAPSCDNLVTTSALVYSAFRE